MNILRSHLTNPVARLGARLTGQPIFPLYIHLKDHNKKINPEDSKVSLSFMSPKQRHEEAPTQPEFQTKLGRKSQLVLDFQIFEDYKIKLLEGELDQEEVKEVDPLWGEEGKPTHFYKNLSTLQATWLTHSEVKDLQSLRKQLVLPYFEKGKDIENIEQCSDPNELAELAAQYRVKGNIDRQLFYEVEQKLLNNFHKISNHSLILLKFAFQESPKMGSPTLNKILNDLLNQSINDLNKHQLIALFYANRLDRFKSKHNLQINIIKRLQHFYPTMTLSERIDWFFIFVDARGPTIQKQVKNRYFNEIRDNAQALLYRLNLHQDLASLPEDSVLKLCYALFRAKTNMTAHISNNIASYVESALTNEKLTPRAAILFFIYLAEIDGGKSIPNQELMASLKEHIIGGWDGYSKIDQIRSLVAMHNLNMFDEGAQQLYANIEMEADNTLLGYFCKLEFMNSSGRQWQILHLMAQLDQLPIKFYQDYKRFYNYVRVTAPDWDLQPIEKKLLNLQPFYNSERLESRSMDKPLYQSILKFYRMAGRKVLPVAAFKQGVSVKNLEYVEFALPQYQLSLDIVTDVERVPGTKQLKNSFQAKVQSLENLGWRHLYVFQEDLKNLEPVVLFDYLYSICQPYFQQQMEVIAAAEQYQADEIERINNEREWKLMTGKQIESWINQPQKQAEREARGEVIGYEQYQSKNMKMNEQK